MNTKPIYPIYEGVAILLITFCLGTMVSDHPPYHQDVVSLYGTLEKNKRENLMSNDHPYVKAFVNEISMQDKGYQFLPRFQLARRLARQTVKRLEDHKNYLKQFPLDARHPVKDYMIHQRQGYEIKKLLDRYVMRLRGKEFADLDLPKFEKIAEGNANRPRRREQWWFKPKDFTHYYFEHATVAMALAVLTHRQNLVLRYAWEILRKLPRDMPYLSCSFTHTQVGVFSTEPQVQVGDTLTMEMSVTEDLHPRNHNNWVYVEVNGQPCKMKRGLLPVAFKVSGKGKQYWTAQMRYCEAGVEKTNKFNIPYWVK